MLVPVDFMGSLMETGVMKSIAPSVFLLLMLQGCTPENVIHSDSILLSEDFNDGAKTGLAEVLLANSRITLAKAAGADGSDAIRVAYIGNQRGSERVLARYPLAAKVERATLSFDVRNQSGKAVQSGENRLMIYA